MDASNDAAESVDQFLARIASLTAKQGPDDAERSKRSEEEMQQARKERQARRAERARSLSPSKTGPTPSSKPLEEAVSRPIHGIDPPIALTPPLQSRTPGRSGSISPRPSRAAVAGLDFARPLPPPPATDEPSQPSPPSTATGLSRSGTLSWQQRPLSRGGTLRSRPLSASIPDLGSSAQNASQQTIGEDMSRKDIAASLASKDPTWFRQTAERGLGSAAYRKNESEGETAPASAGRGMRLPGMSNNSEDRSNQGFEKETPPSSPPKSAFALPSIQREPLGSEQLKPVKPSNLVSTPPSKSPALELPAFRPMDLNNSLGGDGPSLGRTSSILSTSGRPPSPTKGLGGFVESAMMKRSDSVSKRWSVQANSGLKRGDSVASTRPGHLPGVPGYTAGPHRGPSRDARVTRDGNSSPLSNSRPVSSHGESVPITKYRPVPRPEDESGESPDANYVTEAEAIKSPNVQPRPVTPPSSDSVLARSPSKTMDPRRWSPTKSSWLESALNKPAESPRAAKPEMPAWMVSMQRTKQEQQSQPSESVKETFAKPLTSPEPLGSPPLTDSISFNKIKAEDNNAILGPSKTEAGKTVQEILPFRNTDSTTKAKDTLVSKQDEKPSVPSKRNVTPVQVAPSSIKKPYTETPTAAQAKEETVRSSAIPTSPEPKIMSPPILKPKPETPPKTDFRSSLKSRQVASAGENAAEPEFKAVFGKLKRAQTQNYVAPDVLKGNISAGKAALSATGGPQKTKRVDEFKESILQTKEAMKSSGVASGKRSEVTSPTEQPPDPIPEALARRMAMQKPGTSAEKVGTKQPPDMPSKSSTSALRSQAILEKSTPPSVTTKPALGGSKPQPAAEKLALGKEHTPLPPEKSLELKALPAIMAEKLDSAPVNASPPNSTSKEQRPIIQSKPDTALTKIASAGESNSKAKFSDSNKLVARLNPALAGILSRSSSPRPFGEGRSEARDSPQLSRETTKEDASDLTHMTKARARGPKRRAPKTDSSSVQGDQVADPALAPKSSVADLPAISSAEPLPESRKILPSRPAAFNSTSKAPSVDARNTKTEVPESRRPLPLPPKPDMDKSFEVKGALPMLPGPGIDKRTIKQKSASEQSSNESRPVLRPEPDLKAKPVIGYSSVGLSKVSISGMSSRISDEPPPLKPKKSADLRKVSSSSPPAMPSNANAPTKPLTPKKMQVLPDSLALVSPPPEADVERKVGNLSPSPVSVLPLTPSKSKLNTPKASRPDVDSSTKPRSSTPSKINGLGLQLGSTSRKVAAAPILTPPPEKEIVAARIVSPRKPTLPTKSTSLVKPRLEKFFGVLPSAGERADFDSHAFLSAQNKAGDKCKTLSKQIWEVSGDGKKTSMPPQQDHILFEDCMYLCVHSMQMSSGSKSSEVYLWAGDEVSEAAIEDAQLFCRKVARENSAKLDVVKQGKESADFFQALGGIVIIRRNKSSALYMLCGRRHLGHVAFDEVDLSSKSLCTGLPFLISAKFGKLYLWKGKGSNPEDVGCARLIGMDLRLTGEIEEVTEGAEPSGFWDSLASGTKNRGVPPGGAQTEQIPIHAPRLYRVEHDRPKSSGGLGGLWGLRASSPPKQTLRAQVEEVTPFSQKDLDGHHISILDLYQEIYVLIGESAKKPAEFVTAVQVAQEMAVLSPSVQDRPLLPTCYVVLGDPPQAVQSVFRKWKPQRKTTTADQLCVRVEEVVQELGIIV